MNGGLVLGSATPRVNDEEFERAFLKEFREPALIWTAFAAGAISLLFAVFIFVAAVLERHTVTSLLIRAALSVLLAVVAWLLWARSPVCDRHYVAITSTTSAIAFCGAILLPVLNDDHSQVTAIQATPALIFGLWLHYAFLRVPLIVSAGIGWSVSLAAMIFVPPVIGGSEMVRNGVYLVFANIFGMILARLVETRERELFNQRRQVEAARTEARERQAAAEEANRQKTRLIAAVSHDLRQPMTAAVAYLDVVTSRLQAGEVEAARVSAERAQAAVSILGSTLDHLLTAARYDSGTEAITIGFVELVPLLRDLYDAHVMEAERRGIRLRVRLPRERLVLTTDARSIHRVLNNLLSNAVKFTDRRADGKGGVLVAARLSNGRCRIDVVDTGIGIASEHVEEIWKPYTQLNNVERDRERGLGLGLFLVKSIVDQLPDHEISMRSQPRRGSTFTLTLPAARLGTTRPSVTIPAPEPERADTAALAGAYMLVLEDDRDTRLAFVTLLEAWGVLTIASATLRDVLDRNEEADRVVDAIICDYRLVGETNGIDAIACLRDRLGYSPHAVLVTGESDIAPLIARAGPDTTVLHKPFPPDALARPLLRAVRAARQSEGGEPFHP